LHTITVLLCHIDRYREFSDLQDIWGIFHNELKQEMVQDPPGFFICDGGLTCGSAPLVPRSVSLPPETEWKADDQVEKKIIFI